MRGLAGPIDFSPATLRPELLKGTTPAFQTATAVVFASPLLCWPDPAESYLRSPAREIFRSLPCLWNETRILPASRIGRTVVMARRAREEWWLAVLNGSSEMALSTDVALDFLDPRWEYAAVAIADAEAEPGSSPRLALCPNLLFRQGDGYRVQALPGGGALLVLRPQRPVAPPRRGLFGWGFLGL